MRYEKSRSPSSMGKIFHRDELIPLLEERRGWGLKFVLVTGCFDLLHPGHLHLLEEAADLGDLLVLGLIGDEAASRVHGKGYPAQKIEARMQVLAALWLVDYVTSFGDDTPARLIAEIRPHVYVRGMNGSPAVLETQTVTDYGGTVIELAPLSGHSTMALYRRIGASVYWHG